MMDGASDPDLERSETERRPRAAGPAAVLGVLTGRRLRLSRGGALLEAHIALPGYDDPRVDDRVLTLTDDHGTTWVVGVVSAPRTTSLIEQVLLAQQAAPDPAAPDEAALDPGRVPEEGPSMVHDARGRLLFEYDRRTDRAVLHVPDGDLDVDVPRGALTMRARGGVRLESESGVRVRGGRIELEASRGEGPSARVAMQPGELTLVSSALTAAADRVEIFAAKVGVKARELESHVDRARSVVRVLDVRAERIVERAKDVYREVSGLSQTRAGRLKLIAEKAASLVGENTLLKARDRMKVKGERIHLA